MADTNQGIPAGQDNSPRLIEPHKLESGQESLPDWSVPATLGVLLLGSLGAVYYAERVTVLSASVAGGAAFGLVRLWKPLRRRHLVSAVLLVNVALVLAYFWSLGETHHVEIKVTPAGFRATVDGDSTFLRAHPQGAGFGFEAASLDTYRIQATGEAIQYRQNGILDRVAATFRLAQPATAWTNLQEVLPGSPATSPHVFRYEVPAGTWGLNRRDELSGSPGSYILFPGPSKRKYILSVDIARPDGGQSLLVGVDGKGAGYALQLRFDQPDALWVHWKQGAFVKGAGGTGLHHLAPLPEIQRVTRVMLTGYLYALVLVAMALGVYGLGLGAWGLRGTQGKEGREQGNHGSPGVRMWDDRKASRLTGAWRRLGRMFETRGFKWSFFLLVSGVGLLCASLVSSLLLYRIPHVQDSVAYLFQAKMLAGGGFHVAAPAAAIQPFFHEQFMPFYGGKWFSQYPPGQPLMLMVGVLLGAPWLVEPVLAAASLGCIFLLGRRLHGTSVGVIAASLGLASPFWLFLGSSFMSHATGLFFAATFMLCFARSEEEPKWIWPFVAGFLAGMAFITRELTAVGVLGPFFLYALIFYRRWRWAYIPAAAGGAIPLAFLLLYNWVQMGNPLKSTYFAWDPHFSLGFGNYIQPAAGAFTPADGIWNVYQNLSMLSSQLYGWPYAVALSFAFLPFILGAAKRWDYLLLTSFVGVAAIHAFYWAPGLMYGPRYYYEALPALLLLTARGLFELGRLPLRVWPQFGLGRDGRVAAFVPVILTVALVSFSLRFYLPAQIPLYRGYNHSNDRELRAVANAHIHHAIVFVVTHSPVYWTSYGNVFFKNDPALSGNVIYARDEGSSNVLLYEYFPGRSHYRLKGSRLTHIT